MSTNARWGAVGMVDGVTFVHCFSCGRTFRCTQQWIEEGGLAHERECWPHAALRPYVESARTLAHNLAVGGALCAAFDLGDERRLAIEDTTTRSEWLAARRDEWHPGCGRSAR